MSKLLKELGHVKDIRQEKMTSLLEKHGFTQPGHQHASDEHHVTNGSVQSRLLSQPVLMGIVILLGIMFVAINFKVLTELNRLSTAVTYLSHSTGLQKSKFGQLETVITQLNNVDEKLQMEVDGKFKVMNASLERLQSDISDTQIENGILRSKISDLNVTNKKLLDRYIELNGEMQQIKKMQAVMGQSPAVGQ